jgi:tetratricopeptide (TPR) repeat protein
MNFRIPLKRRAAIAGIACTVAAFACRSQIATALVLRGDEFLYRNRLPDAARYYRRAMEVDPSFATAADRYAFLALQTHDRRLLKEAVTILDRAIDADRSATPLFVDRALCLHLERQYARAGRDFEVAARRYRDPRYFTFAGWDAYALARRHAARTLWQRALAADPHFIPARSALERMR